MNNNNTNNNNNNNNNTPFFNNNHNLQQYHNHCRNNRNNNTHHINRLPLIKINILLLPLYNNKIHIKGKMKMISFGNKLFKKIFFILKHQSKCNWNQKINIKCLVNWRMKNPNLLHNRKLIRNFNNRLIMHLPKKKTF